MESFRAQADALSSWLRSTGGRIPNRRSADRYERDLARWRKARIDQLREGTLRPEQERYLDAVAPGWRPVPRGGPEAYRAWAEQLGSWLASADGYKPNRGSADAHERRLADWRYVQLAQLRAGTLLPEREACLDAVAPGWRQGGDGKFRPLAEKLGSWMRSAGRIPNRGSGDVHERELGTSRTYLISQLRTGTLTAERTAYLDAVAPGWRPTLRGGPDVFRARAEDLGRWLRSTGRVPGCRTADAYERKLSSWRSNQLARLRVGTLSAEREACLDAVAAGWRPRARNMLGFPARARALGRWMVWADGRVPSQRRDDLYERRLNLWRREWLRQLRSGTLPSERERYLDEVAPGWRPRARSGVDEFPGQVQALGRWFAAGGGIPSGRSDDLHERRLCRWRRGWLFHLRNGTLPSGREQYLDEVAPGWRPRRTTQDVAVRAQGTTVPRGLLTRNQESGRHRRCCQSVDGADVRSTAATDEEE